MLRADEILVYEPKLVTSFSAPLPEERKFLFEVDERSFLRAKRLLNNPNCRYCGSTLVSHEGGGMAMNRGFGISVRNCDTCGWWCCHEIETPCGGSSDSDFSEEDWGFNFVDGVLRRFKADALNVPVNLLREYVLKHPDILYSLHHRKFEELVADVLGDFLECEVFLTGQTVDGGVDVYLIQGNDSYLVEVKRRTKKSATEGVRTIRELTGVLLISGHRNGIVVSTADHYSPQALRESQSPDLVEKGYSLQLIDHRGFLNSLKTIANRQMHSPSWQELLKRPISGSSLESKLDRPLHWP